MQDLSILYKIPRMTFALLSYIEEFFVIHQTISICNNVTRLKNTLYFQFVKLH